jgi:thiamine-monophosphate kinase
MFQSESEFVGWLQRFWRVRTPRLSLGIGDDAAMIRVTGGHELILTTDLSIEGVHFRRGLHPPRSVGHRALARGLSDIAAMGGTPRFVLVSLALSEKTPFEWVRSFYAGVRSLARLMRVTIIGGDTALVAGGSFTDIVVAGEAPAGRALRRTGTRPGDQVFVSGRLGLSALGLRLLKSRSATALSRSAAVRKHLYPIPRIELGKLLMSNGLASSLIDLSDGLSSDLARLCSTNAVGAALWAAKIPRPMKSRLTELTAPQPLDLALNGGEDYELLFTARPATLNRIPKQFRGLPLHHIGEITRSKGLSIVMPDGITHPLEIGGYDHFRK